MELVLKPVGRALVGLVLSALRIMLALVVAFVTAALLAVLFMEPATASGRGSGQTSGSTPDRPGLLPCPDCQPRQIQPPPNMRVPPVS